MGAKLIIKFSPPKLEILNLCIFVLSFKVSLMTSPRGKNVELILFAYESRTMYSYLAIKKLDNLSSSYPAYSAHRKIMIRVWGEKKTATHTHKGECS